jgi:hypothetical protein
MRKSFSASISMALALAAAMARSVAAADATTAPGTATNLDVKAVGEAMDRLSRRVEEWGTMHLSAALLVEPSTNFNFNLQRGASNYFAEAKSEIQAEAASFSQQVQSLSLAFQVQNNPGLSNPATSLNSSNLPNASAAQAQLTNATGVFSSPQFAPMLGLLGTLNSPNPTLNNSKALQIAAADQTTEAIYRLLGDPQKAAQFAGRKILLGSVTVSVSPGYRTKKGYVADLGVLPTFDYQKARPEVARRWLQGTDLTDKTRAAIIFSAGWQHDYDVMSAAKWLGQEPPFDELKRRLRQLSDLKTKVATVEAATNSLTNAAFEDQVKKGMTKPQPQGPPPNVEGLLAGLEQERAWFTKLSRLANLDDKEQKSPTIEAAWQTVIEATLPGVVKAATTTSTATGAAKAPLAAPEQAAPGAQPSSLEVLAKQLDDAYTDATKNYNTFVDGLPNQLSNQLSGWNETIPDVLKDTNSAQPLVMGVSPLADLDVTAEGSSQRSQASFALSLAALLQKAGLQAQAAAFEQFANRLQEDAQTRTALPAVNSYSEGGLFGWQIGPRFRAMKNPGGDKKGRLPANILERQTFPALIIVGFNQEDLTPRVTVISNKVCVLEPHLTFRTVPRWLPLDGPSWLSRCWSSSLSWLWHTEGRYPEYRILKALAEANKQWTIVTKGTNRLAFVARVRSEVSRYDVFGQETDQSFDPQQVTPLPEAPAALTIAGVFPTDIFLEPDEHGHPKATNVTFVIVGSNLKTVQSVTTAIGGVTDLQIFKSGGNNILELKGNVVTNDPIVFELAACLTNSTGVVTTNHIFATNVVRVAFHQATNAPVAVLQTVLTPPSGTNGPTEFTVKIAPKYDPKAIEAALSIIINEINKAKRPENANVSVQVQAEQKTPPKKE